MGIDAEPTKKKLRTAAAPKFNNASETYQGLWEEKSLLPNNYHLDLPRMPLADKGLGWDPEPKKCNDILGGDDCILVDGCWWVTPQV